MGDSSRGKPLVLGTMNFGGQVSRNTSLRILDKAYEYGIRSIDCAEIYPNPISPESFGVSESIVGDWLRASPGKVSSVKISTKIAGFNSFFWLPKERRGPAFSPASIEAALQGSLSRLGVENLETCFLHWPQRPIRILETEFHYEKTEIVEHYRSVFDCLGRYVDSGLIRTIGISNETHVGRMAAIECYRKVVDSGQLVVQEKLNVLSSNHDVESLRTTTLVGASLAAYSPLEEGVLTGKYANFLEGEHALQTRLEYQGTLRGVREATYVTAVLKAQDFSRKIGISLPCLSINWLLSRDYVNQVVLGASLPSQLTDYFSWFEQPIEDEVLESFFLSIKE